ncbi:hypothetical protein [Methylobacterium nigriterrae]|uniref:hypothetical protein n=1 Tax=Methylobacterium nigriterrae TaxID=3127512 RepID=UPI003013F4DD
MPGIKQKTCDITTPRKVLVPYIAEEAITATEAQALLRRCRRSLDYYIKDHGIGRRIHGRVAVSRVAVQMLLEDDREALALYVSGDRSSDQVAAYYHRLSIPLPAIASTAG